MLRYSLVNPGAYTHHQQSWQQNIHLILILLIGFALRLYRLGAQSLWYDETVSAFLASRPIFDLIGHTARDIHPPGYYLLLRGWTFLAGHSEFALAFFSLFWGMLLLPLTYSLALRLANRSVASWAMLLAALSPYHLWYSQEVRMYTLAAALGLVAALCLWQAMRTGAARYRIGYVVAATVGLYSLYYFAFLLITLNLFFLLRQVFGFSPSSQGRAGQSPPRLTLKALIVTNLLVLLAYLPWLPIAWRQATNPPVPPWRTMPQWWAVLLESWTALSLGQSVEAATVWPVLLLTLALSILGATYFLVGNHSAKASSPSSPAAGLLLLSYTFGPLLLIYLLSLAVPLYHVRYIFTYAPAFYIILAAGVYAASQRLNRWAAIGAAGLLVVSSFYSIYRFHFNPTYQADDFRAAVNFIQDRWQPGDVILVNAGYTYPAFLTYADDLPPLERHRLAPYPPWTNNNQPLLLQTGTVDGSAQLGWGDPRSDFYAMSTAQTVAALEQVAQNFSRLWLLRAYDTVTDPNAVIRTWLAEHTIPLEDQVFTGPSNIRAQGFLLPGAAPPQNELIPFEDGMALTGWSLPQQSWQAGQTIPLKLWWTTTAPPSVDYKSSLKLWSSSAELAAAGQDEWPVGTLYRATAWPVGDIVYHPTELTLPPDLPSGQYWLNVELYHPETVQPLARQDNGETVVTLGLIEVK